MEYGTGFGIRLFLPASSAVIDVHLDVHRAMPHVRINWPSVGSVIPGQAREFAASIEAAARLADVINALAFGYEKEKYDE